jgi:hypothetical protein
LAGPGRDSASTRKSCAEACQATTHRGTYRLPSRLSQAIGLADARAAVLHTADGLVIPAPHMRMRLIWAPGSGLGTSGSADERVFVGHSRPEVIRDRSVPRLMSASYVKLQLRRSDGSGGCGRLRLAPTNLGRTPPLCAALAARLLPVQIPVRAWTRRSI